MIVASERTENGVLIEWRVWQRWRIADGWAGATPGGISARRVDQRSKGGSALEGWISARRAEQLSNARGRPPPGVRRERRARVVWVPADAAVIVPRGGLVGLLLDRPPDDVDQAC